MRGPTNSSLATGSVQHLEMSAFRMSTESRRYQATSTLTGGQMGNKDFAKLDEGSFLKDEGALLKRWVCGKYAASGSVPHIAQLDKLIIVLPNQDS